MYCYRLYMVIIYTYTVIIYTYTLCCYCLLQVHGAVLWSHLMEFNFNHRGTCMAVLAAAFESRQLAKGITLMVPVVEIRYDMAPGGGCGRSITMCGCRWHWALVEGYARKSVSGPPDASAAEGDEAENRAARMPVQLPRTARSPCHAVKVHTAPKGTE